MNPMNPMNPMNHSAKLQGLFGNGCAMNPKPALRFRGARVILR